MRRAALALVGVAVFSAVAQAQLVPLARCHAAYPCNMPYGLLPADAAANLPDARLGNTLIGIGVDGALKPRLIAPPVSTDPSEDAARLYVRRHPLPKAAAPNPTPEPKK